jgi:hypothetical protein
MTHGDIVAHQALGAAVTGRTNASSIVLDTGSIPLFHRRGANRRSPATSGEGMTKWERHITQAFLRRYCSSTSGMPGTVSAGRAGDDPRPREMR